MKLWFSCMPEYQVFPSLLSFLIVNTIEIVKLFLFKITCSQYVKNVPTHRNPYFKMNLHFSFFIKFHFENELNRVSWIKNLEEHQLTIIFAPQFLLRLSSSFLSLFWHVDSKETQVCRPKNATILHFLLVTSKYWPVRSQIINKSFILCFYFSGYRARCPDR